MRLLTQQPRAFCHCHLNGTRPGMYLQHEGRYVTNAHTSRVILLILLPTSLQYLRGSILAFYSEGFLEIVAPTARFG